MAVRTTLLAVTVIALVSFVATFSEAHSWADCVDWRFNDPQKPGWSDKLGKCFAHARKFPVKRFAEKFKNDPTAFAHLDSDSPNRHYQQERRARNPKPCSDGSSGEEKGADETRQEPVSLSYGGEWGVMANAVPGQKMCIRWPSKNHANESNVPDAFLNMPPTPTTKDPDQIQLMGMTIAKLKYGESCSHTSSTDTTPCGACFEIPADRTPGMYMMQWRWELNKGEWYASCWDIQINNPDGTVKKDLSELNGSTSIFAELAE